MNKISIANNDISNVLYESGEFADEIFSASSDLTLKSGTILARYTAGANNQKLTVFAPAGADGAGVPVAVISYDVDVVSGNDVSIRPAISGKVIKEKLIIHADGNDSNITKSILDQLRNVGIVPVYVSENSIYDNQ